MSLTHRDTFHGRCGSLHVSRTEGIIPALETAHAFAALQYMDLKKEDVVVINLSGRGDKDLNTYMKFLDI